MYFTLEILPKKTVKILILFYFFFLLLLELHKHWEAEDELLDMQNVMDETEIKLQDARAEITRLNKKLNKVFNFYLFSQFCEKNFFIKLVAERVPETWVSSTLSAMENLV